MIPVGPIGSDSTVARIEGGFPRRFSQDMGVPGVIGGNTGLNDRSIHYGIGTDRAFCAIHVRCAGIPEAFHRLPGALKRDHGVARLIEAASRAVNWKTIQREP